jgi:S-formylglutathione hydrolase FrmB
VIYRYSSIREDWICVLVKIKQIWAPVVAPLVGSDWICSFDLNSFIEPQSLHLWHPYKYHTFLHHTDAERKASKKRDWLKRDNLVDKLGQAGLISISVKFSNPITSETVLGNVLLDTRSDSTMVTKAQTISTNLDRYWRHQKTRGEKVSLPINSFTEEFSKQFKDVLVEEEISNAAKAHLILVYSHLFTSYEIVWGTRRQNSR